MKFYVKQKQANLTSWDCVSDGFDTLNEAERCAYWHAQRAPFRGWQYKVETDGRSYTPHPDTGQPIYD